VKPRHAAWASETGCVIAEFLDVRHVHTVRECMDTIKDK
jgi:hypothetical protein